VALNNAIGAIDHPFDGNPCPGNVDLNVAVCPEPEANLFIECLMNF
jgi:hypothetical protein